MRAFPPQSLNRRRSSIGVAGAFVTLIVMMAIARCTAADPFPEASLKTPREVAAARKLYAAKCAKCHRFYEPKDYSDGEWKLWMDKMAAKSKLKPIDSELLAKYLAAYRAGLIETIPPAKTAKASR